MKVSDTRHVHVRDVWLALLRDGLLAIWYECVSPSSMREPGSANGCEI